MKIGVQVPNFTYPDGPSGLSKTLVEIARTVDAAGVDTLAVMDHLFQIEHVGPPENDMLEAYTTLGFLAGVTERVRLLTLVTATAYRHPGFLAKTVTTLDVLSGGRAWLGIGAAWFEQEAVALGIPFPPVAERFERLEETLRICLQMWAGDETPFEGEHFTLARPLNSPQSLTRPHPPIMIGGGGEKKTLRLVAKYADACNLFMAPDLGRKLDVLREHCEREGRDYDSIEKTVYYIFDPGENGVGVDKIIDDLGELSELGVSMAVGQVVDVWKISPIEILGSQVVPVAEKL